MLTRYIYGRSDTGRVRANNEDAIGFDATAGIAVLADGMGGLEAGEVASRIAVDSLMAALLSKQSLQQAVVDANQQVFEAAQGNPAWRTMGTTVIAVCLDGMALQLANVGDSRVYRYRGKQLEQLSHDHSVVQQLLDTGALTEEEAWIAPNRNIITRALGIDALVEVDLLSVPLAPEDLFMLCSDGLSDMLRPSEIATLFERHSRVPAQLVDALVDGANAAGGVDNVSVVLIGAP